MAGDSIFFQFVDAFAMLREQLACPACEGELRLEELASQQVSESASQHGGVLERLVCVRCGRVYPIVDGIPVFTAGTRG